MWSPRVPAAAPTPRQALLYDAAWWGLCMFFVLPPMLLGGLGGYGEIGPWPPIAAALGVGVALRLRRTVPIAALLTVVALGAWTVVETAGGNPSAAWPPALLCSIFVLSYLVGRLDAGQQPMLLQVAASIGIVLVMSPILDIALTDAVALTIFMVFVILFPWLIGRYRYQNAELTRSGWQRAEQLEREQRAVADQARLRERTRIAEDMHDSLGHELSLIALRAAALEVDRELPQRHQEAAGQLRRSAATATERLREIIGLLRDESEAVSVTPVDESIGDLVDRARSSGMDVAYTTDAEAPPLPHMADRAAHRVVQESLTNAAKHAPGRAVTIVVASDADFCTVTITNDLPDARQPRGIGGGRGLVGLAERVRLAGGKLHSGPRAGRYEVVARLPYDESEAVAVEPEPDTESVRQHVQVRIQARRRLLAAFALPAVMLAVLGVSSVAIYLIVEGNSILTAKQFDKLEKGQTTAEAAEILPAFQMFDPPTELGLTDLPEGTECEYYPSRDSIDFVDVYEVCFRDDVLISKYVITAEKRRYQRENSYGG